MNETILNFVCFFVGCLFILILKETGLLAKFEKYAYRKKKETEFDRHVEKYIQEKRTKFDLKKAIIQQNKMKDV
jgi:hypothetical protein